MSVTWVFCGFCWLLACALATDPPPPVAEKPDGWLVVWGQGGGFTGGQGGYRLLRDGTVQRWSRLPGKPEKAQPAGQLSPERLAQLRALLADLDWESLPPTQPGNLYTFIRVATPNGVREITWPGLESDAPSSLQPLLKALRRWVEELEASPSDAGS